MYLVCILRIGTRLLGHTETWSLFNMIASLDSLVSFIFISRWFTGKASALINIIILKPHDFTHSCGLNSKKNCKMVEEVGEYLAFLLKCA